jgi:hypothetical protein
MKTITTILALFLCISLSAQNPDQCHATTKAGTQCKRTAIKGSSYCYQHNDTIQSQIADTFRIYTGSRGGKYQIKNGVKHYLPHSAK